VLNTRQKVILTLGYMTCTAYTAA